MSQRIQRRVRKIMEYAKTWGKDIRLVFSGNLLYFPPLVNVIILPS